MNTKNMNGSEYHSSSLRLLSDWGRLLSKDPLVCKIVRDSGLNAEAYIQLKDPDILMMVRAGGGHLTIKSVKSVSGVSCFDLNFFVLHRILIGAQNLMIGLNKRSLDQVVSQGMPAELLVLLLDVQPILSRIYRSLLSAERDG